MKAESSPDRINIKHETHASPSSFPFENLPWGINGVEKYEQHSKNNPEKVEAVKQIFETVFELEVKRLAMFESEMKRGVSFPLTSINLRELAEAIYTKQGRTVGNLSGEPKKKQVEFLFGSILGTTDASPFDFFEEPFSQMVKRLPNALKDLEVDREPEDFTVYTLSSPIHELGTMSPEFLAQMKKDPYRTLGDLYAESVERLVLADTKENQPLSVNFTGISMGASLSGRAAENLLVRGLVTQEKEEKNKPQLSLTAYEPAGRNESPLGILQVPLGFIAETGYQLATNPDLKKIEDGRAKFAKNLREVMAARGVHAHMDDEQAQYKKEIVGPGGRDFPMGKLVRDLVTGVPMGENVKSNEIVGRRDPTLYSPLRHLQALAKDRQPASLGSSITSRTHKNRRVFGGVKMSHSIPSYRESVLRRMDRAAEEMLRLRKTRKPS